MAFIWKRWKENSKISNYVTWWSNLQKTNLLRLHVKRRSAKTRQPVLTSLYRSVYIVWKSFTCGRRVGEHLLCRLVNKGLYGVGKHAHWLQISLIDICCSCLSWSWCRELWIVLHTVKSIHSRRALTFTACVDVTIHVHGYRQGRGNRPPHPPAGGGPSHV